MTDHILEAYRIDIETRATLTATSALPPKAITSSTSTDGLKYHCEMSVPADLKDRCPHPIISSRFLKMGSVIPQLNREAPATAPSFKTSSPQIPIKLRNSSIFRHQGTSS